MNKTERKTVVIQLNKLLKVQELEMVHFAKAGGGVNLLKSADRYLKVNKVLELMKNWHDDLSQDD